MKFLHHSDGNVMRFSVYWEGKDMWKNFWFNFVVYIPFDVI